MDFPLCKSAHVLVDDWGGSWACEEPAQPALIQFHRILKKKNFIWIETALQADGSVLAQQEVAAQYKTQ